MSVGRTNSARAIAAAVIFGFLLFALLVAYAPDAVPFSPNNYGWDGLEAVASTYRVNFTISLSGLPGNSVLVVLQPTMNYTTNDVTIVRKFLAGGGTLLVADKSGVANSLLLGLDTGISIQGQYAILDPIYNWKDETLPTALVFAGTEPKLANVTGVALSQPRPLVLAKTSDMQIARTSPVSYDVLAGTTASSSSSQTKVAQGPFTVAAATSLGNGTAFVVGDSQFISNSEWRIADNHALIRDLFANTNVFIDASHWTTSPLTSSTAQLKAEFRQVYSLISNSPLRYLITAFAVVLGIALTPSSDHGVAKKRNRSKETSDRGEALHKSEGTCVILAYG